MKKNKLKVLFIAILIFAAGALILSLNIFKKNSMYVQNENSINLLRLMPETGSLTVANRNSIKLCSRDTAQEILGIIKDVTVYKIDDPQPTPNPGYLWVLECKNENGEIVFRFFIESVSEIELYAEGKVVNYNMNGNDGAILIKSFENIINRQ